ncbi:MAG: alpha/beta fold hydrolase [Bacteroidetes bacterium]|nr:hypothetical protein AWN76_013380 [Rhodothermaceae bacterium RA]RMH62307.1 MAG: alpha/beta fold hydrolase [Bacteroidota bacterium]
MPALLILLLWGSTAPGAGGAWLEACLEPKVFTVGTYVEEPVAIEQEDVTLAGRLLRPNRPGPHPGVVLIPGGGRDDRLNYPPRFVAARLARCGIAALIYDKRGTGRSDGDFGAATFEDLVADALAALRVLRRQDGVDAGRVGLIGFSQGGRLAPVVAAREGGVAFVVSISSPFTSVRQTRRYALEQAVQRLRLPVARRDSLLALWDAYLARLEAGASTRDLDTLILRLPATLPAALRPPLSTAPPRGPLFNSIGLDTTTEWQGLRVPFLALFGAQDQVVPVAASLRRLREVLGEEAALEVLVVPGVDHSFQYPGWGSRRFRFEEVVVAWVLSQTGLLGECALQLEALQARATPQPRGGPMPGFEACTSPAPATGG